MRHPLRLAVALALLAAPAPAAAQVVYDGGAPDGGAGFDIFNDFRAADDFALAAPTSFGAVRFWGLLPAGPPYTPDVSWEILLDGGGLPGASVAAGSAPAAPTLRAPLPGGFASWQFDLLVGPQILGAGIYWLALHDGALGDITDSSLIWETTGGGRGSDFAVEFLPTADWTGGWTGNLAFQLRATTVIPEPASALLLAAGLAALGAARRRERPVARASAMGSRQ